MENKALVLERGQKEETIEKGKSEEPLRKKGTTIGKEKLEKPSRKKGTSVIPWQHLNEISGNNLFVPKG